VVVCAHNEASKISNKIQNLLSQENIPNSYEVVVVSDGSTDDTAKIARSFGSEKVHIIEFKEQRGKCAILNDVVPKCHGEILVLTDVRQSLDKDAVARLCENFLDPDVGAASGELLLTQPQIRSNAEVGVDSYWSYEKMVLKLESSRDSICYCTGAFYAIRKSLFTPIKTKLLGDDFIVPVQIILKGKRVVYDERARAFDKPAPSFRIERHRKIRTQTGNFQVYAEHPELLIPWKNRLWFQFFSHKFIRLLSPYFLITFFFSGMALSPVSAAALSLFLLQLGFYTMAFLGLFCRNVQLFTLAETFVFFNWTAVLGFVNFLKGVKSGAWKPSRL
jgi:cellulose synthase/poly-beta-1,6-N-acetylglucosamine synthase-like glycosyltransferase